MVPRDTPSELLARNEFGILLTIKEFHFNLIEYRRIFYAIKHNIVKVPSLPWLLNARSNVFSSFEKPVLVCSMLKLVGLLLLVTLSSLK